MKIPRYKPSLATDLPTVRPEQTPESGGRAARRGTAKQLDWAHRIRAAAAPRIMVALDDLLRLLGEEHLREFARTTATELLDRLDARQWIDWQVNEGARVDPLVAALWRRCRAQAYYRRALPAATAWRAGLVGGHEAAPVVIASDAFEQARRIGYAVIGPTFVPGGVEYRKWCRDRGLPFAAVDVCGEYSWFTGPVKSDAHGRVSLSWQGCRRSFTTAQQADLTASCRVCIPRDDHIGAFQVSACFANALVPRGLAVPLVERLRYLVETREHPAEGPESAARPLRRPVSGEGSGS